MSDAGIRAGVVSVSPPSAPEETAAPPVAVPLDQPAHHHVAEGVASPDLERRVEKLEKKVVVLEDTTALEERVYQRVLTRLPTGAAPGGSWLGRWNPFRVPEAVQLPVASSWLLMDMLTEARFLLSMIADARYRMSWPSRIGIILCLGLIVTSGFWFPLSWFPLIGVWLDKLMTLVLAFFLFKILARETQRYRAFLQSRS